MTRAPNAVAPDDRVGFVVAGVQKGGTTALFDHLGEEPGLSLSREKELHFFDDERQDRDAPDVGAYHARFAPFDGRMRGEATPIYLYWPGALARIRAYNPAMKLIVMLRDPVERAWSHWRMEFARGAECEPFAWCIREGRARLFEADPWGFHREFSYVERGFYGEQLGHAFSLFPRDQVLVLRSETLREAPAAALAQLRAFLGLPPGPDARPREAHVGPEMAGLEPGDVTHLRQVYARDQILLNALTGIRYG
jgi:hypothetical protein